MVLVMAMVVSLLLLLLLVVLRVPQRGGATALPLITATPGGRDRG